MSERDKFLTEAMGEIYLTMTTGCTCCGQGIVQNVDFSTWQGFGKLWEWAKEQEWWGKLIQSFPPFQSLSILPIMIHPDRFADAVYEYLKEGR